MNHRGQKKNPVLLQRVAQVRGERKLDLLKLMSYNGARIKSSAATAQAAKA